MPTKSNGTPATVTPAQIAQWLRGLIGVKSATPCTVTIGAESWPAARYEQEFEYTAGMACVTDGRHKAGEKYTERRFYCAGKLPAGYGNRTQKICFPKDGQDWYVAGYLTDEPGPQFAEYHPFGPNFLLAPWDLPEPIDKHEPKPYRRVPLIVAPVEEPAHA